MLHKYANGLILCRDCYNDVAGFDLCKRIQDIISLASYYNDNIIVHAHLFAPSIPL